MIVNLAKKFGISFNNQSNQALANAIAKINKIFAHFVSQSLASTMYTFEDLIKVQYQSDSSNLNSLAQ